MERDSCFVTLSETESDEARREFCEKIKSFVTQKRTEALGHPAVGYVMLINEDGFYTYSSLELQKAFEHKEHFTKVANELTIEGNHLAAGVIMSTLSDLNRAGALPESIGSCYSIFQHYNYPDGDTVDMAVRSAALCTAAGAPPALAAPAAEGDAITTLEASLNKLKI